MSALFLDYPLQDRGNTDTTCFAWNKTEDILAVGFKDSVIRLFKDEGKRVPNVEFVRSSVPCTLDWQPRGRLLLVGWEDGAVSICNPSEKIMREGPRVHTTRLTVSQWAPGGNRFVTADENGVVGVWKTDNMGNLSVCCQYKRQGAISHCVFVMNRQQRERLSLGGAAPNMCPNFIFGGEMGTVHYADELGHISDVHFLGSPIDSLLFYEEKGRLIIITRSFLMVQLAVANDGKVSPVQKVKLSVAVDASIQQVVWAGPGLLCTNSAEQMIRFWDVSKEENYILPLSSSSDPVSRMDKVSSIDFNPKKRILAAGTRDGRVLLWKYVGDDLDSERSRGPEDWEPLPSLNMKERVIKTKWGYRDGHLAVETPSRMSILAQNVLLRKMEADITAVQVDSQSVSIARFDPNKPHDCVEVLIQSDLRIKGLACDSNRFIVWSGHAVEVYELEQDRCRHVGSFESESTVLAVRNDTIYRAAGYKIEACNSKGTVKESITLSETDGLPVLMEICGRYMAIVTSNSFVKLMDLGKREMKLVGTGRRFEISAPGSRNGQPGEMVPIGVIRSVRVNCTGNRISILSDRVDSSIGMQQPDSKLYIYNVDADTFSWYDFGPDSYPISHCWDTEDNKLIAVETAKRKTSKKISPLDLESPPKKQAPNSRRTSIGEIDFPTGAGASSPRDLKSPTEVTTLFVTPDNQVVMQDSFEEGDSTDCLLGIRIPYICFVAKQRNSDDRKNTAPLLKLRVMRDFVGMKDIDEKMKLALMDFSYYLTIGNMDEAYRSVRLIQSASVWENMAHMCVKTKRLDVALVCLANMGHARGAAAVREAMKEPEAEVPIAMVAIQLGLVEEAAKLYKDCGRHDLLNRLYQASGRWEKAMNVAAEKDRVHLKNTHFRYARHLESLSEVIAATKHYEKSETHVKQVTRMLNQKGRIGDLESYISQCRDPGLIRWWGQYLESKGKMDKATKAYKDAQDYLSILRMQCAQKDFEGAMETVRANPSPASAFHLAKQLELNEHISDAIHYYTMAGRYNHAFRLAKQNNMDGELMSFALMSTPALMLEAAEYFEEKEDLKKAVQLFHKGGNIPKALELCFKAPWSLSATYCSPFLKEFFDFTAEFEGLHRPHSSRIVFKVVSEDLKEGADANLLARCGEFFMDHGQYDRALQLFLIAKRYNDALELAMAHKIKIDEKTAEKFVPEGGPGEETYTQKVRQGVLMKLAKLCKSQGNFHLAAKKYTQAGAKLKAMKCLLKSGDTEKIIFFANVSRTRDIYILAANYLQNLDWPNDPKIMQNIISFYTKAKAYEQLSGFYDACALVEMDEFHNYEKALSALKEAAKHLHKVEKEKKDDLLAAMNQRIETIQQFIKAKDLIKDKDKPTEEALLKLLEEPKIETAIRPGDAYALLVNFYYRKGDYKGAHRMVEEMQQKRIILNPYLDHAVLSDIYKKLGIPVDDISPRRGRISSQPTQAEQKNQEDGKDAESDEGGFVEEAVEDEVVE